MDQMLETSTRRIVCHHRSMVEAFKGYTMSVSVVPEGLVWFAPEEHHLIPRVNTLAVHCMILGEDAWGLVRMFSNLHMPNLGKTLDISLAVAPYLEGNLQMVRDSLDLFFNEPGVQENLLSQFRKKLRGVQTLQIAGIDTSLATAIKEDIAKDEWTDPKAVLADLQATKQRGIDAFKAKELRLASKIWEEAINDIERIHQSSSWRSLTASDNTTFIDSLVEIYFQMCLNVTRVQLNGTEKPISGYPKSHSRFAHLEIAVHQIDRIANARTEDWWKEGYTWEPSEAQVAKLLFRHAMCFKADALLNDDPETMLRALTKLAVVAQYTPDDVAVRREVEFLEEEYTKRMMSMSLEEEEEEEEEEDDDDMLFFDEDDFGEYSDEDEEDEEEDEFADMPPLESVDREENEYADMPGSIPA